MRITQYSWTGNDHKEYDRCLLIFKEYQWSWGCKPLSVHYVAQKTGGKQIWVQSKKRCYSSIAGRVYLCRSFKQNISWIKAEIQFWQWKGNLSEGCKQTVLSGRQCCRKGHMWMTRTAFPGPLHILDSALDSFRSSTSLMLHNNLCIIYPQAKYEDTRDQKN